MAVASILDRPAPRKASFTMYAQVSKRVKRRVKRLARQRGVPPMDVAYRIWRDQHELDMLCKSVLTDEELQCISRQDVSKIVGYAVSV